MDFSDMLGFPIMPDASVLGAGRNSRIDVGTERAVFKAKLDSDTDQNDWQYIFCGVMTHSSTVVDHLINNSLKKVLPFEICT
jgi:hypothetical protein